MALNLMQKVGDAFDFCLHSRPQNVSNLRQRQMHQHKELASVVVNRMSNPLDFLFQSLIQKMQRCDRIAITALGHLVRGEAFRKELRGGVEALAYFVLRVSAS